MENEPENVIDRICSATLPLITRGIRAGSSLPAAGESFEFYHSYPAFARYARENSDKILNLIQRLSQVHGRTIKSNLSPEDLTESILDANDHILEGIGERLDEASGIHKNEKAILPDGTKAEPKQIVSSWNRQKDKTVKVKRSVVKIKPQLIFKDKTDNTSIPFVPKLSSKPNSNRTLPTQLLEINKRRNASESLQSIMTSLGSNVDLSIYNHPYKDEILEFAPKSIHIRPEKEPVLKTMDEVPLTMVSTILSLDLMISSLKSCSVIAIDLEHHSYRSYFGFTCLMQVSTGEADFIVDTLELRSDLHRLNEVTTNPDICKVFHGGQSDVKWLQKDFGIYLVNMFDTFFAAQQLKLPKQSYDYLLQYYCSVKVDKRFQLSDWRIRPLPLEMVRYARQDTHYLLYVFDRIRIDLEKQNIGTVREIFKRSRELSLMQYRKRDFDEEDYMNIYKKKNRKKFNSQQLEAFKLLFAWRDQVARHEDECTDYVCPNHTLLQISEILPREKQGILACFSYEPALVKQNLQLIHKIIKRARDSPLVPLDDEPAMNLNNFEAEPVENSIVTLHDWSKTENFTENAKIEKIKLKTESKISDFFGVMENIGSKEDLRLAVEKSFSDPLHPSTIPYNLYLPKHNDTESLKQDDSIISKIWKMKKVDPVSLVEKKILKIEKIEEEISIAEMKAGKRKMTDMEQGGKKHKVQNIKTQKFDENDFKIFGAAKNFMNRAKRGGRGGKRGKRGGTRPEGPAGFTEPNFGKVTQKSRSSKSGTHHSFTHSSK